MWMELALGLCLGCKIYGLLTRRGWIGADPEIEVCADGGREPEPVRASSAARVTSASGVVGAALAIGAVLVFVSPAAAAPDRSTAEVVVGEQDRAGGRESADRASHAEHGPGGQAVRARTRSTSS